MGSARRRKYRDYRFQGGDEMRRVALGSLPEFIEINSAILVGDDIAHSDDVPSRDGRMGLSGTL